MGTPGDELTHTTHSEMTLEELRSLQMVGGEVEVDTRILEQIKEPLIHLLRNAV